MDTFFAKCKQAVRLSASIAMIAILACSPLISVGRVEAQDAPKADSQHISESAIEQIASLIREKESRSETQRKIDSRLLYQARMSRGEQIADGIASLQTGLSVGEKGMIDVDITANVSHELLRALKKIGSEIIVALPQYRSVTARVPIYLVEEIAGRADVIFVQPKHEAMTNRIDPMAQSLMDLSQPTGGSVFPGIVGSFSDRGQRVATFLRSTLEDNDLTGTITSQADTTHRAAAARTLTGFDGSGIKIGVLSNGVNSLASRQATGDLPPTVTVLPGQAGAGDEGTAMLELVHDLAPGAQLFYATGFTSITSFAQNIKDLRTAGCDIIIDDITYFTESPFQDGQAPSVVSPTNAGVVTQAVNDVTVGSQAGALYFSSASNSGNKNDGTAGVWEGDFVDGGTTGAPLPAGYSVHDFGGGVTNNLLTTNGRVTLKWSDPLGGSGNDYDLYVLNNAGSTVTATSSNVQSGSQDAYEDVGTRAANERVVIIKSAAAAPRFLHLNTNRGTLSVSTSGVVYGHNAAKNAISVAATPSGPARFSVSSPIGPFPGAHGSTNSVEVFSSDGPRRYFYLADGSALTPGNASSTGGAVLQKPDITAADGSSTTTPGFIPFFGTSAAAPHAGALMALLKQASPASTNAQLYNAMISSAIDIEAAGADRDSGAGIFMPLRAMNALGLNAPALLETGTITVTEYASDNDGKLEPGESGNLNIPLLNVGLTNATAVSATVSTSTPGVTIINTLAPQAISYPNIPAADGTSVPAAPFRFFLDPTFPCGGSINFALTVNYTGGVATSQIFNFTATTGPISASIVSTLDATAPPSGLGYTATTGTQTGRLNRNGIVSSCATAKLTPGLQDLTAGRRYDAYTFTASDSGCTTVTLSTTANNAGNQIFVAVYGNGGYLPASIQTNYLADWGVTMGGLVTVGFNAIAGQQFTIVVHEITVGGGTGVNYTLNVSGPLSGLCLVPTAASVHVRGRVAAANGTPVANALVTMIGTGGNRYYGRTNGFGVFVIDGVQAGDVYLASVSAKGNTFAPQIVSVTDNVSDLNFAAQ